MIKSITLCVALALTLATSAAAKDDVPCQQKCSIVYGPKWTKCDSVQQCESYVEQQYRSCVRKCEGN